MNNDRLVYIDRPVCIPVKYALGIEKANLAQGMLPALNFEGGGGTDKMFVT